MEDTLTISDPSLNGMAGSLVLGFSLDATGNATGTYNANGISTGDFLAIYAGTPVSTIPPPISTVYSFTTSTADSYFWSSRFLTFGQPFPIQMWFEGGADAGCENESACASWAGLPVSVGVNASDTAILDSLTVYDSNGDVIAPSDWSVTAASGLDYTAKGIVPEPSSYGLLALCLGVLALVGRSRRRAVRTLKT